MKQKITKEGIKELINQDDLSNALEALVSVGIKNAEHSSRAILLNATFNRHQNQVHLGIIGSKEQAIIERKIIRDTLNLLKEITIPDIAQDLLKSKSLIANGKIDEAFHYLKKKLSDLALLEEIDVLNNFHEENKDAAQLGLVSLETKQIQTNKVSYALLSIINRIEENEEEEPIIEPEENIETPKEKKQNKKKKQSKEKGSHSREKIKTLIIENDFKGALAELNKMETDNRNIENEIIILNSRFNQLQQEFENDFISHEDYTVMYTKLKRTALYIVNDFELD